MLDWGQIDTVFLDMDGTLLDLNFDNHFWLEHLPLRYAERQKVTVQEAKDLLLPKFDAMRGSLEWYCLDYWGRELSMDIPALKREVAHLIQVHQHVDEFLQALHAAGKRVVLLTNAHGDSVAIKMDVTGIADQFDRIISTHDIGIAKEQDGFWAALKQREQFEYARSVMVDDNADVLHAARHSGVGFVLAMKKPDSTAAAREMAEFPAIHDFREVMPI